MSWAKFAIEALRKGETVQIRPRGHPMRILTFIAALSVVIAITTSAQPLRPPDPPTPQQAYEELLSVRRFAFGGVGYAGVTSRGEIAYCAIAASTNALKLYSAVLTNGNAQAKLYALCGIRQFAPVTFDEWAKPLVAENPQVETMHGCIVSQEHATDVVARIKNGTYDIYLKTAKR
jgi:hypothetical protein